MENYLGRGKAMVQKETDDKGRIRVIIVEPMKVPRTEYITPDNEGIHSVIGDYYEMVRPWPDGVILLCDENGKYKRLDKNRYIPEIGDTIAGTFILCSIKDYDVYGLSDEQCRRYTDMFKYPEKFIEDKDGTICIRLSF